jgi:hypothetical protein
MTEQELEELKRDMLDKHQEAVTAAYKWCCALPLGSERIQAFEIYNQMRLATRL